MATRSVGQAERRPDDMQMMQQRDGAQRQVLFLLTEIAREADAADRHCFYAHSSLCDDARPADVEAYVEQVSLELDYLRCVITRLGWTADQGAMMLGSWTDAQKKDPREWLLAPVFFQEADHG